jgi:aminocarboxymuconate-semialdehyde decarboxylase
METIELRLEDMDRQRIDFAILSITAPGVDGQWRAGRIDYEAQRMPGGMGRLQVPPSEHLRRLYADIVCDWPPAIRALVDFLGAERIMFGSDYPLWDPARRLRALAAADLEPETDALIRDGTTRALFGIQPPTYEFT